MTIGGRVAIWAAAALLLGAAHAKNGFDLSAVTIPADEILQGGPPKDGIPAIMSPVFTAGEDADFIGDDELVIGVVIDNDARAYPIKILNWHEVVNDDFNGMPVAVTYCPLCGSGVVFDANIDGQQHQFGVSGLLYNSDVLLYDRQSDSLWSQLLRRGVSGKYADTPLRALRAEHLPWGEWRRRYPGTKVLTTDTGEFRDYNQDPYAGYVGDRATFFPVKPSAPAEFHPKEWVLGVVIGDSAKAYPFSQLAKNDESQIRDKVGGEDITIHWNAETRSARAEWAGDNGAALRAFWFAWFAFHPDGEVFRAE